jgi:dinuclear metal center YbgI/SA1388 family protein
VRSRVQISAPRLAVAAPAGRSPPPRALLLETVIASVTDLTAHLDALLRPAAFDDYGPNGLQVPGRDDVSTVVTGVSASAALLTEAVDAGADLVLVHHGLFWGERGPLDRELAGRLRLLLAADVGLAAYHLPLDAHLEVGNNALLARALGATAVERFAEIGVWATLEEPIDAPGLLSRVREVTQREPLAFCDGPDAITRLAVVSGAGASLLPQAIEAGADAFITGEPREPSMASARENAIHFFAAGHHATERLGVQALGERLAAQFGVRHVFVDVQNPV